MATRALILLVLLLGTPARGADVVPWQDAGKHVGEQATVEGVVAAVHCSPLACSLAFEPTFTRFTAIIQAAKFDIFPPDQLEPRYRGTTGVLRHICHYTSNLIRSRIEPPKHILSNHLVVLTFGDLEKFASHGFCKHHRIGIFQAASAIASKNLEREN